MRLLRRPRPLHPTRHILAAACALLLWVAPADAATPADGAQTGAKPAAKPAAKSAAKAATKPAPATTPATAQQQAKDAAKGLALATETTEAINAAQLDISARVLTGAADCEFNQRVVVQPVDGQAGHFTVSHQGRHYRMVPRETSTGAVRLEDAQNGVVWLQIPAKSMLMNARRGQRMVDSCMHAEQRAAVAAATAAGQGAGQGIGIVPQAAAAAVDTQAAAAATPPAQAASR
jgi:hypothetical protein